MSKFKSRVTYNNFSKFKEIKSFVNLYQFVGTSTSVAIKACFLYKWILEKILVYSNMHNNILTINLRH